MCSHLMLSVRRIGLGSSATQKVSKSVSVVDFQELWKFCAGPDMVVRSGMGLRVYYF